MDTVTYLDAKVIEILNKHTVPIKVDHDAKLARIDREVKWTPQLFLLDPDGNILAGSMGFLPPQELVSWILTGNGKREFMRGEMNLCTNLMEIVLNDYPDSHCAPQALYLSGVALFNDTHEPEALKNVYVELKSRYPESIWTQKALPYRLL